MAHNLRYLPKASTKVRRIFNTANFFNLFFRRIFEKNYSPLIFNDLQNKLFLPFFAQKAVVTKYRHFDRIVSSLRASRFSINFPPTAADTEPVSSETTIATASVISDIPIAER